MFVIVVCVWSVRGVRWCGGTGRGVSRCRRWSDLRPPSGRGAGLSYGRVGSFLRKLPTSRANSRRDVAVPVATVASVGLAVAVAGDDGPALCCGPHSGLAADVEDSESGPRMIRLTEQSQASMRMVSTSTMSPVSVS
jgi:hypothetical protein